MSPDLLRVEDLTVTYPGATAPALAGCSLGVASGRTLAVVGPSGCGKSTLARALLGLLPAGASRSGRVLWQGQSVVGERAWRELRGRRIGLILQDPQTALNPVLTVGEQIGETLRYHLRLSRDEARIRTEQLLGEVRLPDARALVRRYPHELSGGMRQRVTLAAALAPGPAVLVADEPTAALDVTTQRDILLLLRSLQQERRLALVFVTHDLDLVPVVADHLVVLAGGAVVESGPVAAVMARPASPVTISLLTAAAFSPPPPSPVPAPAVLTARDVVVTLGHGRDRRRIVDGVDLCLRRGEIVGLAGESGCGKTTLARALAGHLPFGGTIEVAAPAARRSVQLVFQDPAAALDPRQRVRDAIAEAAAARGLGRGVAATAARDLMQEVGLPAECGDCFPHELSGGQQRRVGLGRALAAQPAVLIADEPTSSLDPPTRALILGLLCDLRVRRGLTLLLISHDLGLLRQVCQRIAVMRAGAFVEVFSVAAGIQPTHPYTLELAAATPVRLTHGAS